MNDCINLVLFGYGSLIYMFHNSVHIFIGDLITVQRVKFHYLINIYVTFQTYTSK